MGSLVWLYSATASGSFAGGMLAQPASMAASATAAVSGGKGGNGQRIGLLGDGSDGSGFWRPQNIRFSRAGNPPSEGFAGRYLALRRRHAIVQRAQRGSTPKVAPGEPRCN